MAGAAPIPATGDGRGPGMATPMRRGGVIGRMVAPVREARGLSRVLLWTGIGLTVFFAVLAVAAPWIAPYSFDAYRNGGQTFPRQGHPGAGHVFGTTVQGFDVLSRVVYGARTALEVVVLAVLFSATVGVPLGLVSGYVGGWFDRVLVLVMDALFAFPYLLLAIIIAFLLSGSVGGGILTAAIAITVVYVPQYFRVVRNSTISAKQATYVEAARAIGARPRTVMTRYLFANVIQSVPVIATLNAADAILTLAGLGFLGYGIQPTVAAEWGYDLQRAIADVSAGFWWTGLYPGLAIVLLVTGVTLVGEGLNDVINPTLRRRAIRDVVMPAYERRSDAAPETAPATDTVEDDR